MQTLTVRVNLLTRLVALFIILPTCGAFFIYAVIGLIKTSNSFIGLAFFLFLMGFALWSFFTFFVFSFLVRIRFNSSHIKLWYVGPSYSTPFCSVDTIDIRNIDTVAIGSKYYIQTKIQGEAIKKELKKYRMLAIRPIRPPFQFLYIIEKNRQEHLMEISYFFPKRIHILKQKFAALGLPVEALRD